MMDNTKNLYCIVNMKNPVNFSLNKCKRCLYFTINITFITSSHFVCAVIFDSGCM